MGKGLYVYQNNTSGDLFLPRATKSGVTRVGYKEEFQGDDYYMFMLGTGELRLTRIIEQPPTAQAQAQAQALNEAREIQMEDRKNVAGTGQPVCQYHEDKLITEQPPVVTNEGTVEFVAQKPEDKKRKLHENRPYQLPADDVLLNENPLEGIEII